MAYRVELWRGRGSAAQCCGEFGPYADRAAALADAAALRPPGVRVKVVAERAAPRARRRGPRRNAGPRAAALGQVAMQLALSMAQAKAQEFAQADEPHRLVMLRKAARRSIPLRLILRDEDRARALARMIGDAVQSGAVDTALQSATIATAARSR